MTPSIQVILQFRQQTGGESPHHESYYVEATQAPGYGWGGPFQIRGLDDGQAQAVRLLYRSYLQRQQSSPLSVSQQDIEPLRTAGSQLFLALPETLQQRLHDIQAQAQSQGRNLELVLAFTPSAQPLLNLPWELLHNPISRTFFALRGGGISRRLVLPTAPQLPTTYRPQQILGVWAQPSHRSKLDEREKYTPSPTLLGPISTWIQGYDTLNQMQKNLAEGWFDGLHLVAHGRGGATWHDFSLALVDAQGAAQDINADQFTTFLAQFPELKFVYLDVCSAADGAEAVYAPGGMAVDLVNAGVPLVIVMQDKVAQKAAGLAAQEIYHSLNQGATLAEAVTHGRRAIRLQQDDPIHWSVPVLYGQLRPRPEPHHQPFLWWLDRENALLQPTIFLWVAVVLLSLQLSHAFSLVGLDESLLLMPLVLLGQLLPILAGAAVRYGYKELAERYRLEWRGWLVVLQHKYLAVLIRGFGAWGIIWVVWLALYWAGWLNQLSAGWRQLIWLAGLGLVIGAGVTGAYQGMRQNLLFWRTAPRRRDPIMLFIGLLMPLIFVIPSFSAWVLTQVGGIGVLIMVVMAVVIAAALENNR